MEKVVKRYFGVPGIEPRPHAPKACILPLYYTPENRKAAGTIVIALAAFCKTGF